MTPWAPGRPPPAAPLHGALAPLALGTAGGAGRRLSTGGGTNVSVPISLVIPTTGSPAPQPFPNGSCANFVAPLRCTETTTVNGSSLLPDGNHSTCHACSRRGQCEGDGMGHCGAGYSGGQGGLELGCAVWDAATSSWVRGGLTSGGVSLASGALSCSAASSASPRSRASARRGRAPPPMPCASIYTSTIDHLTCRRGHSHPRCRSKEALQSGG